MTAARWEPSAALPRPRMPIGPRHATAKSIGGPGSETIPASAPREPLRAGPTSTGMGGIESDSQAITASLMDPRAFAVIFERHFDAIHGYLRRRFDDELAKDITAQTFFVAFDRRSRFDRRRADSLPWLFGIATNLAHSHRRREQAELRAIAAMPPELGVWIEGVESRVDADRMRNLLAESLADLPAEEADVLYLLVWGDLNQAEIAAALAIPLGTVKSRLSRARGRLQPALGLSAEPRPAHPSSSHPGGDQWTI